MVDADIATIVVDVLERGGGPPDTKRQRVEGTIQEEDDDNPFFIRAPAAVLARASARFRASLEGGFVEAETKVVRVEVDTWKELETLHKLVAAAQREPEDYVKDAEDQPLKMQTLFQRLLVACTFQFLDCIKQCHREVKKQICRLYIDTEVLFVPEAFLAYPEVADIIDHAVVTLCKKVGQDYRDCANILFTLKSKRLDSLAGVRMVDLVQLSVKVCGMEPTYFAKILRARRGNSTLCDNAFYTAILCYLDQSLACKDLDEAQKQGVYEQLAEAFFPCNMTGDYLSLVVSTCPYVLKSGMLPRVMASAGAPPLIRGLGSYRLRATMCFRIPLDDLLPFKTNQKQYHTLGMVMGRVLIACVERRKAAKEGQEDLFALSLLTIYPGTAAAHGGGPFAIHVMDVDTRNYNVFEEPIRALVHFEDDPEPSLHEMDPEEARVFSLDRHTRISSRRPLLWKNVVTPDSQWFMRDKGKANCEILISMKAV